jgi:hypothetical protein
MKKCSKCKSLKPLNDFNNAKKGKYGVHHYCKVCLKDYKKNRYNYIKSKLYRIKSKYKISELELNEMFIIQDKSCKICKNKFDSISEHKGLYIDHCHKNGKVRGLLCKSCNSLLGYAYDDIKILESAILYLLAYK